jgi:hypothetical protein
MILTTPHTIASNYLWFICVLSAIRYINTREHCVRILAALKFSQLERRWRWLKERVKLKQLGVLLVNLLPDNFSELFHFLILAFLPLSYCLLLQQSCLCLSEVEPFYLSEVHISTFQPFNDIVGILNTVTKANEALMVFAARVLVWRLDGII